MKLIFFDESKPEKEHQFFQIGAICLDERNIVSVENLMSTLSNDIFGSTETTNETEFHASEIYHRKKNFKDWTDHTERLKVIERLTEIICSDLVQRIDIRINVELLSAKEKASDFAFMFLCEKANDLSRSSKQLGMLIGDRENDRLSDKFSKNLSGFKSEGTDYAFGRKLDSLVDTVHFTHSHLSRFLQLADVWTWLLQFKSRNGNSKNPKHLAILNILMREDLSSYPTKYKHWP